MKPTKISAFCKKLAVIFLLFAITTGGSGCKFMNTEEGVQRRVVRHMEKKYDEEFVMLSPESGIFIIPSEYQVSPKAHPEWVVDTYWDSEDNSIKDNYVCYLLNGELEEL
ncbi:MAG: hypothetical protein WAX04_00430, partial [Oscillospiraceae bacterium]